MVTGQGKKSCFHIATNSESIGLYFHLGFQKFLEG